MAKPRSLVQQNGSQEISVSDWCSLGKKDFQLLNYEEISKSAVEVLDNLSCFSQIHALFDREIDFDSQGQKKNHIYPLLLEIAVLKDKRGMTSIDREKSEFQSIVASFIGEEILAEDEENPHVKECHAKFGLDLVEVWQESIQELLETNYDGKQVLDFSAHPEVYEKVLKICHLFKDACPAARYDALKKAKGIIVEDAGVLITETTEQHRGSKSFPFRLPESFHDLNSSIEFFQEIFEKKVRGGSGGKKREALMKHLRRLDDDLYIVLIPFRRQIDFELPSGSDLHGVAEKFGRPGGCFVGMFYAPLTKVGTRRSSLEDALEDQRRRFRKACVRVGWLLQESAIVEGKIKTERERDLLDQSKIILRLIGHAVQAPVDVAYKNVAANAGYLTGLPSGVLKSTIASLRLGKFSVNGIDFLIRTDKQFVDPSLAKRKTEEYQKKRVKLNHVIDVVEDFVSQGFMLESGSKANIETYRSKNGDLTRTLPGDEEMWLLGLSMLIRNASQAAEAAIDYSVKVFFSTEREHIKIRITNSVKEAIPKILLDSMNRVLNGHHAQVFTPEVRRATKRKSSSLGLGIMTVGRVIEVLTDDELPASRHEISASYANDEQQLKVNFELSIRVRTGNE